MHTVRCVSAAALLMASSIAAVAVPVTFVHTGAATGSLDGIGFGYSEFTITATGDTDNIASPVPGVLTLEHDFAAISITGVGDYEFVTRTQTFFNDNVDVVGFQTLDAGILDLFDGPIGVAALDGWDMTSPLASITGTGLLLQWYNVGTVVTDGIKDSILRFDFQYTTATIDTGITPVPLPAALPLFMAGLGMIGFLGWRRRRTSDTVA